MEMDRDILEQLRRFLEGEMDANEARDFKKIAIKSQEIQELIKAHKQLDAFADEDDWNLLENREGINEVTNWFRDEETIQFKRKLNKIGQDYKTKSGSRKKSWQRGLALSAVAAVLAALFYLVIPQKSDLNTVYKEYNSWSELPSLTVKGQDQQGKRHQLQSLFNNENYQDVINISDELQSQFTDIDPNLLLYKGISQIELDEFNEALLTFSILEQSNTLDAHKALWYKSLVYMKQGDKEATIKSLEQVLSNEANYRYADAKSVLDRIR